MKSLDDVFNEAVDAGEFDFSQQAPKPEPLSLAEIEARPPVVKTPDLTPQILSTGMSMESRSPDQVAQDNKIIQKTGMPTQAFNVMTPERAQAVRTLGDTPENFVQEFPLSSKVLSNPQIMAIAKDDIQSLQTVETVLSTIKAKEEGDEEDDYGYGYGTDLDDNAGVTNFEGLNDFAQGLNKRSGAVMTSLAAAAPAIAEGIDGLLLAGMDTLIDGLGIDNKQVLAVRSKIDEWRKTNSDITSNMTKEAQDAFDSKLAKIAVSGIVSGGQNLLTLATAAALTTVGAPFTVGAMTLGMMGLFSMGSSYGEAKEEGLNTVMSLLHGVANGSLEVATEKLGLDSLIKMGKSSGFKELLRLGKNYILGEHVGEQINTLVGDLESWALIDRNKGKTIGDYFNERGRKAFETAIVTTVGGTVQMGGALAFNAAVRASQEITEAEYAELREKEAAGIRSQELLKTITELSNNSKIAMRSPESMPKIVADMVGEKVPYAYLPAEVLNQSGMEDLLLQSAPELSEEIASAKKSGADVKIPIETMTRLTQSEAVNKAISQEIKFSPDELNARQAQERTAQLSADIEAQLEQEMKAVNPTRQEEIQGIASNVTEQLTAAGMRPEEAKANGQIHAAFFNTMATLMGVSPSSLAQQYGINVSRGIAPGQETQTSLPITPTVPATPIQPITSTPSVKPTATSGEEIESGADLQNRDRGKGSSVAQMRSIAANLQYGLVGPGHNLGNDAPIVSYGTIPENQLGAEGYVIAGKGSQKIPIRYAVVDASEIQTSNDAVTGAWNSNYGNKDLVNAIIGNGRLSAMKLAYAENTAESYKADFAADKTHGIDPAVIASVKNPVLVRVIDPQYVNKDLIDESNNSSVQRMSPAEVARNDARVLDLDSLRFNADGSPTAESVINFVKWLDPNEAAGLIDGSSQVTRQAVDRLNAAIFAKAYQDDRLVSMYAEAQDPESRLIISALARIAPQAARLADKGDLDVRAALVDAVNQIIQGRKKNYKLADIAKQTDMFADPDMVAFIELFALNPRSTRVAVDILWDAMEKAADSVDNIDTSSGSLFDDPAEEPMKRSELMELIRSEMQQAKESKETLNQDSKNDLKKLDSCRDVLENCVNGTPVMNLDGTEFVASERSIHDTVAEFFEKNYGGVVENPVLGSVKLNKRSVKDSVSHGIGRNKSMAFAAVPEVIKQGMVFDFQPNWKGRNYDTYVIAAPISIKGERFVCEVVVLDSGTNKRFYLHEVNPLKDIVAATQQDPYREGQQPQPARPVRSILVQRYFESNKRQTEGNKEGSKQDSEELYQSEVPNDPLITIHNIDEGNLNKALDLGGFAVPSLGITKQSTPYSDFGGISLIGTRDMVDPKKGTPVFSQDAYTQTFPQPVWEKSVNQEGASKLSEELEAGYKEAGFDESRKFIYSLKTAPNKDALVKTLLTSKLGAYLFLKSKGIKVEPVAAKPVELTGVAGDTQVLQVAEDILKSDPKLQNPESIKRLSDAFINYYQGRKGGLSQKILSRSLNDDGTVELTRLESILRSVKEAETRKGKAVDNVATGEAILKKANEYREEFESWAQGKANGAFDAPKIEVKGKLKPVTLGNVVEAMKSRVVSNQESTFVFGEGKVRASTAQKFGSIEEIQENRDKVTDSGTVSSQNKAIGEKFDKFRALASKSYKGGESIDAFNSAMEALARVARKRGKLTEAKVRAELMKEFEADDATVKLGLEILSDLNNSLTDYFEAKPQRAVTIDEFRGAVVPEKTSDATIKRLEDAGLTVMRYGEQPGARTQAVQELTNRLNSEQGDVLYQNDKLRADEKLQTESQVWAQKIDSLDQKPSQPVVMLTQTPLVMTLVGARFRELRVHPHLFDGIFPQAKRSSPSHHVHEEIDKEVLKQIPKALSDPIAIFKDGRRENTFLFMLDVKSSDGRTVVVPVEFEARGRHAVINLIKTAWGPKNDLYFPLQEKNDSLSYVNEEKLSHWNKSSGIYSLRGSNDSGTSVLTEKDLVNAQSQYPGYYQNQSGPRGAYSPSQRLITLFQSSDPSTFIHESGHFFLDVMTDLANRPDAPQQLRQDMKILMSWFGVKSLDAWNAMTLNEKREYHEKFARGFERYMREGKAPSVRLMRVFHSFMNWLKGVYSSVRQLNVDLTPEVREVMDRMLATDKEIRTAKAVMGLANTYITRDQFPGTDEEWYEWEEKIKDEDDYARARLTAQVLGERAFLEKRTAEYQAKYADEDKAREDAYSLHYREALDKHREEPIYKMRKRMLEDKEEGKPIYPIARADVDFLPKEQIEELDRLGILSEDGYPLDVLSRQFGYENETAFITDLINVASLPIEMVAKRDAEKAVRDEFGDRLTPDKIRELAMKSALNDLTLERLSREMALLNSGKRDPVVLQAAKAWADEEISKTKIKDLKPGLYSQAMRKYQRAYERALAKGDIEAAKEAKKKQLFNAAAMKAVTEAQDRVNFVIKDVKRMGIRYRKVLRKEQDAGFLDQILYLAGLYQIRDEHNPRESFSSFAESMEDQGFPMGLINSSLFEATNAKDYQDMTVDEFTELDTALSVLSFHGMNLRKRVLAEQKAKTESWVQSIIDDIVPGKKANKFEKVEPNSSWIDSLSGFFLSHRKFSSLMREMGGLKEDSAMMQLVARLNHCGDRESYMQQEAGRKLVALLDSIKHTKLTSQVYIANLNQKMSRAGMIAVALNSGNKINKERLSTNINEVAQAEILSKLTKEELDFVQGVWDMLESYWPEMEALEKRTNGISPRKVEAEPLKVHTIDGFDVELTGGYYPIVYDPGKSVVSAEQQIKDLGADMIRGSNQSSATKQGHLKSRSEKVNRNLLLDLSVIERHLQQVTHDICYREWVQETNRIFRNKDFKDVVTENFGVQFYRALSDHLLAIAGGGSALVNPALEGIAGHAGNFLKGNVSFNAMALSITTVALQPLGITQSIQRVGAKWVFAAGLKMAINPYAAFKECHEKSLMMRMRADVMNADIADFNALTRKGKLGKVGRTYEKVAFAPMQYMQMLVDVPTWQAAYQKALAEGLEENRAIEVADQAVLDSQGGGHNKDRSLIHRNHPFATMFYSYFSSMENLWAESLSQQQMKTIKGQAGFLRDFTLLLAIPSLGQALIFSALRGDDWDKEPEEWLLWVMRSIGGTALGMIVYIRELSAIFSGFDYSGPPMARIINDGVRAVKTLGSERAETDSKVLGVLGIIADCVKIPFTQLRRSYNGWKAYIEGDTDMPTSVLFGKPQE